MALGVALAVGLAAPRGALAEPPPTPTPGCPPPAPPATPVPPPKPRTGFESRILRTADVIVVGTAKLMANLTVKGTTIARVTVEKALKGTSESTFTLFVPGSRNTDDPRAPSAPYVDENARRSVLFLKASPNGSGWSLLTLFPIDDRAGQEKLGVLERELSVLALSDAVERKTKSVALYESLIADVSSWTKTHGIREVESLSRESPEAFDDASLARLDSLRSTILDRSERAVLSAALDRLDPTQSRRNRGAATAAPSEAVSAGSRGSPAEAGAPEPGSAVPQPQRAAPSPLESRGYRKAKAQFETALDDDAKVASMSEWARIGKDAASADLLAAFKSGTPAVRERAAVLLGDVGSTTAWPTLRMAYATEKEPVVREAIVRAAGYLGGVDDIAFVVAASDKAFVRARCFALARIRTPASLAALTAERTAAQTATPPDTSTATLVDYLMTPAFEKTDPAIRVRAERAAGPASAPDAIPSVKPVAPTNDPPK